MNGPKHPPYPEDVSVKDIATMERVVRREMPGITDPAEILSVAARLTRGFVAEAMADASADMRRRVTEAFQAETRPGRLVATPYQPTEVERLAATLFANQVDDLEAVARDGAAKERMARLALRAARGFWRVAEMVREETERDTRRLEDYGRGL